MRRANQLIKLGITGLGICAVILLLAHWLGSKFDALSILMPFIAFLIIGLTKRIQHVKK